MNCFKLDILYPSDINTRYNTVFNTKTTFVNNFLKGYYRILSLGDSRRGLCPFSVVLFSAAPSPPRYHSTSPYFLYLSLILSSSVPDPHRFDADPDPACHFDADPDTEPTLTLMRIRIRILASKKGSKP